MLALLLATPSLAEAPPGLSPMAGGLWTSAERDTDRGDIERAVRTYVQIWRVEERPEAILAAGHLLEEEQDWSGALRTYRLADDDPDVALALAALCLDPRRPLEERRPTRAASLAEGVARVYPGRPEPAALRARALAALDQPDDALIQVRAWLGFDSELPRDQAVQVAVEVYQAFERADRVADATPILEQLVARVPESREELERLRDRAEMEELADKLAQVGPQPLTGAQREIVEEARRALAAGRVVDALAGLDALLADVPLSPEARGLRAEARRRSGDPAGAEQDLVAAEALDPLDPRWPEALGELLEAHYAGRHGAEALAAFDRALRLQPRPRTDLLLRKAHLELRLRRVSTARATLAALLAQEPDGPDATEARALLDDLERARPEPEALPLGRNCPDDISDAACRAFWRAYVYHRRDNPADPETGRPADAEVALDAVREAREAAPGWVRALNLEATIRRAQAEHDPSQAATSLALFEESLTLDPDQPDIWVHLGKLRDREGDHDGAVAAWEKAVAIDASGGAAAHVYLAEEDWAAWRPFQARAHVEAYLSSATSGAVQDRLHERATAVRREVDTALVAGTAGLGGLGLLAVAAPLGWLAARRRGQTVDALLDRAPGAWRDVARIASAVRHEVLKHHTTVLDAVADALEAGDDEPASWASERLFGDGGALERAERYLAELRELGRRHGVVLDLRKDRAFGPLVRGLTRLRGIAGPLGRGARRIVPELHAISDLLHAQAYPALGALVRTICVLPLDQALLSSAWNAVLREPALRGATPPELELTPPEAGLFVRAWKDEVVDILVNVLRNAVQASRDHARHRIGLRLVVEEDPLTLLERVAIRIGDEAPRTVSTAMIRGRYIERGLGLTVDLISRNGGSIHVEDEPGFSKAVVVRLPLVEAPDLEAP